jgi:flagellar hook-length control protein FliK
MNLGISLDTSNANPSSTDLGSASATSSGSAGQAGEVFGQLMAKALQQQGKGQRHGHELTEEAPATNAQETAQAAALASETGPATDASGEGESGDALATGLASGHSDDALAQFNALWMPGMSQTFTLPASAGVKSVNVGPSIQVITASNPAPDANSLTAFAHQQGLDAQAIAWLMNPRAQATATAAAATTVPGSTASGLPTAGASPGMAPATLPGLTPAATSATSAASEAAGTALTSGMTPATSAEWGTTVSAAATTPATTAPATAMASTLPATGPAGPAQTATGLPDPLHPASDAKAAALAAAVPVVQAILSGPASRAAVPNSPSPHQPTAPELSELSAMTMAQLRWGGVKPRGIGQADNSTPAPATSTATPTLWAQSDLDLSGLGLELGLLTPNSDTPTQNASNTGSPAPTDASAIAGAALGGVSRSDSLASQARNATASANAMGSTVTSDQMQQLSEKMADAVGERILREIERGQWNLRLMLKPAHLGHIEVEMRLRAGQLDASFVAPQAATRELLQDGLDKLRQQLDQAGMDVANLHVKDGQTRQNGGDSTPGQRQFGNTAKNTETPQAPAPSVQSPPRPSRPDGWDVTV